MHSFRSIRHSSRRTLLRCLPLAGAAFGLLSAAQAQIFVTVTPDGTSSAAPSATTVTFSDVTPSTFYGTNGGTSSTTATNYYTSPNSGPTALANSGTNGTATFTSATKFSPTTGALVTGDLSGQYSHPTTSTGGSSGSGGTYLAIGGSNNAGDVTMTFSNTNIHDFGLFWGSPDSYNKITINLANGGGSFSYVPGTANGGFNLSATQGGVAYVTFSSAANPIASVVFDSTKPAFETDDISFGVNTVPEPATWLGGCLLLGGAGLAARRRGQRAC